MWIIFILRLIIRILELIWGDVAFVASVPWNVIFEANSLMCLTCPRRLRLCTILMIYCYKVHFRINIAMNMINVRWLPLLLYIRGDFAYVLHMRGDFAYIIFAYMCIGSKKHECCFMHFRSSKWQTMVKNSMKSWFQTLCNIIVIINMFTLCYSI